MVSTPPPMTSRIVAITGAGASIDLTITKPKLNDVTASRIAAMPAPFSCAASSDAGLLLPVTFER
jgi:hypothetical protein